MPRALARPPDVPRSGARSDHGFWLLFAVSVVAYIWLSLLSRLTPPVALGCLLRDLPAWPRTLNLIRSQLTKPDVIRVQLQGAVAAVPPSLSRPHLHKEGSTERARLTSNVLPVSDTTCHRLETTKRTATRFPTSLAITPPNVRLQINQFHGTPPNHKNQYSSSHARAPRCARHWGIRN